MSILPQAVKTLDIPALGATTLRNIPPLAAPESPLPTLGPILWDEDCCEFQAYDSDGICYFGDTPAQVYRQFHTDLAAITQHARRSGIPLDVLCQMRSDDACGAPDRPY